MVLINISGKRCRVFFENLNRYSAPKEYHYLFRTAILEKLRKSDPSVAQEMHDRWDVFWGFSGFLGKQWNTPIGLQFRRIEVDFASPDEHIISSIRNALLIDPLLNIGGCRLKVTGTEMEDLSLPDKTHNVKLESIGELVIKKPGAEGRTEHVSVNDDVPGSIADVIERQYGAFSGKKERVPIVLTYVKQKKKAIVKDRKVVNSFLALRVEFSMKASPELIEFVLTQGIGHHRKLGFGMVRLRGMGEE